MPVEIIETTIEIDGSEGGVLFTNLTINQLMADINQFSFLWQMPDGEVTLDALMSFYNDNLAKEISISIGGSFTFKGIITSINCVNQSIAGAQYEVKGYGLFIKLDEVKYSNSFYKKKYKQIVEELNTVSEAKLSADPKNNDELFYTVQYNQSIFEFYRMLAIRYGEWMYYTGTEMKIGTPSGDPLTVMEGRDLIDIKLHATMAKTSTQTVGYDHFTGEKVKNAQTALSSSAFTEASLKAGEKALGDNETHQYISHVPNNAHIEKYNILKQNATVANSVKLSAKSYMPNITLGGKLKVQNQNGDDIGDYIITEIQHVVNNKSHYVNHFTAVPADIEVPPYTNPDLFPVSNAQYAVVVDNEDKDGLDRLKVRFHWQKDSDKSPWLSVITPHAGNGKGIRFLPEKDDEVMIDFVDKNAEKPFILGAVHTEKNKSGNAHEGNNLKVIGTRTGRRLEIDDDKGTIVISDFNKDEKGNKITLTKKDDKTLLNLTSGKDDKNYTQLFMKEGEVGGFELRKNGKQILWVQLIADGQRIEIGSEGDIDIIAKKKITLKSDQSIDLDSGEINLKGNKINLSGMEINVAADVKANITGAQVKAEASAQLQLKGGAMAELQAPIVKIN